MECDYIPNMHEYNLYWIDPDNQELNYLGGGYFAKEFTRKEIKDELMNRYWDNRLDSADCMPVVLKMRRKNGSI